MYGAFHSSEDEYKFLISSSSKDDPEAVSIGKPATRHSGMIGKVGLTPLNDSTQADRGRKIIPRGPQPRNTLSRVPFTTGPAADRKTTPNPRGRIQHALAVEVHKGSNVSTESIIKDRDETLPTPPSAKRRKLDRQASPASSDQTDPLDQISPHAMSFRTGRDTSPPPSRPPSVSASSQTSVLPMKRSGSFEYRLVEHMMDSTPKPKSKKQRHNDNRNYPADHVLLPPSPPKRSSMSNPIDISGDESQPTITASKEASHATYRGTARQPPPKVNGTKSNTSESIKQRTNPTQSPYFNKPRLPTSRANGDVKQKSSAHTLARENSPGLAQKFVAADGTRRGSDVNASSDADELQSVPTTVGQNANPDAVFTVQAMRSSSPSKKLSSALKATIPTDDLAILAPSIIKSDFPNSNAQSRRPGRPPCPVPRNQEADAPWAVGLAAISLPTGLFKDDDLGLVYDQKSGEYYIQRRGSAIKTKHSNLTIQPRKLIKILWENSGTKTRLESSRNGMEDNVLDLEFTSERDMSNLIQRLKCSLVISKSRYGF